MEFKGTKGKWTVDIAEDKVRKEDGNLICVCYHTNIINKEESKYNAKLISCAPEILDMLKEISEEMKNEGYPEILSKVNNLIKKATEI